MKLRKRNDISYRTGRKRTEEDYRQRYRNCSNSHKKTRDLSIKMQKKRRRETELNKKRFLNKVNNFKNKLDLGCRCKTKECENVKHWYILQLESDKKYVGTTSRDVETRYQEHDKGSGFGSSWTEKYKPISIFQQGEFCSLNNLLENEKTLEMMSEYGIGNVRGGQWTVVTLSGQKYNDIQISLDNAFDRCYKCNQTGHFSSNCSKKYKSRIETIHINKN